MPSWACIADLSRTASTNEGFFVDVAELSPGSGGVVERAEIRQVRVQLKPVRHPLELTADFQMKVQERNANAHARNVSSYASNAEPNKSSLLDLHGIGPSGASRLLVEVGDITRFPNRDHFASWNGTAPTDASSGDQVRHRLSRKGNRQINRVVPIMATVRLCNATEGRAYYDRPKPKGRRQWRRCGR